MTLLLEAVPEKLYPPVTVAVIAVLDGEPPLGALPLIVTLLLEAAPLTLNPP